VVPIGALTGKTIPGYGYFLITGTTFTLGVSPFTMPDYQLPVTGPLYQSGDLPFGADGVLRIVDSLGRELDLVGWRNNAGNQYATWDAEPSATGAIDVTVGTGNSSYERKANAASTDASLKSGGADYDEGNGYDTNNNIVDFAVHTGTYYDPQNSLAWREKPGPEDPDAAFAALSHDFGVAASGAVVPWGLGITNRGATLPLNVTGAALVSGDVGDFTVGALPGPAAAGGGVTTLTLNFTPNTSGKSSSAVVQVDIDDTLKTPTYISLLGTSYVDVGNIAAARALPDGTYVRITGTVVVISATDGLRRQGTNQAEFIVQDGSGVGGPIGLWVLDPNHLASQPYAILDQVSNVAGLKTTDGNGNALLTLTQSPTFIGGGGVPTVNTFTIQEAIASSVTRNLTLVRIDELAYVSGGATSDTYLPITNYVYKRPNNNQIRVRIETGSQLVGQPAYKGANGERSFIGVMLFTGTPTLTVEPRILADRFLPRISAPAVVTLPDLDLSAVGVSVTGTVPVDNIGAALLKVLGETFVGANAAAFSANPTPFVPFNIAVGGPTVNTGLRITATDESQIGLLSATMRFTCNDPTIATGLYDVTVQTTVTGAVVHVTSNKTGATQLECGTTIPLSQVRQGAQTSATVTIANAGNIPLNITNLGLAGAAGDLAQFSLSVTGAMTIPPSSSQNFVVYYTGDIPPGYRFYTHSVRIVFDSNDRIGCGSHSEIPVTGRTTEAGGLFVPNERDYGDKK